MRISIVLALSAVFVFSFCDTAIAKGSEIGQSLINPASPMYFLKSVEEILEVKFVTNNKDQGLKQIDLAKRRLEEVKSLIMIDRGDLVSPTLEKYWSSLSKFLNYTTFIDDRLKYEVLDQVGKHIILLEDSYYRTDNQKARISIRAVLSKVPSWNLQFIEKLNNFQKTQLSAKIKSNQNLICDFLSKEASSSALNQTERAVLLERGQKCFKISQ